MRASVAVLAPALCLSLVVAFSVPAGSLGLRLVATLAGFLIPAWCVILVRRRRPVVVSPADWVTLARGVLAGGCLALTVFILGGTLPTQSWVLASLAAPAALLDAVDGWVARRTGTASPAGAILDVETDAAFVATLSVAVSVLLGPWVLLMGAAYYLFRIAGRLRPALRRPLARSAGRRVIAALQSAALVVAVVPVVPVPAAAAVVGAALGLLFVSFGRDIVALERHVRELGD